MGKSKNKKRESTAEGSAAGIQVGRWIQVGPDSGLQRKALEPLKLTQLKAKAVEAGIKAKVLDVIVDDAQEDAATLKATAIQLLVDSQPRDDGRDMGTQARADDGTLITCVIPCVSCNAFLSLTKKTALDQICQACKTVRSARFSPQLQNTTRHSRRSLLDRCAALLRRRSSRSSSSSWRTSSRSCRYPQSQVASWSRRSARAQTAGAPPNSPRATRSTARCASRMS